MKTGKKILICIVALIGLGGAFLYCSTNNREALPSFINKHTTEKKYIIQKAGKVVNSADTLDEAIEKAEKAKRSIAINTYNKQWVYSDFEPFLVITENAVHDFANLKEAIKYAKKNEHSAIYYKNNTDIIWKSDYSNLSKISLDVPLVNQKPELPRGCEVTSLTMIMKYAGIDIDKMTLATEIKKDTTPYQKTSKRIYAGNPYDGFVGDMYNQNNFGYGVYHGPITELAKKYCSNNAVDLSDLEFEDILCVLQKGYPIWVITNGTYDSLDDSQFEFWHTPTGIVKITYKLHSVVITGFDDESIYINDPLSYSKNIKLDREKFRKAWEQMGQQAVAIIK